MGLEGEEPGSAVKVLCTGAANSDCCAVVAAAAAAAAGRRGFSDGVYPSMAPWETPLENLGWELAAATAEEGREADVSKSVSFSTTTADKVP